MNGSLLSSFIIYPLFYRGKMKWSIYFMLLMQEGFLSRSVVQVIGPPLLSVFWVALFLFYLYGELKLYCIGVLAIFAISGAIGGIMS